MDEEAVPGLEVVHDCSCELGGSGRGVRGEFIEELFRSESAACFHGVVRRD